MVLLSTKFPVYELMPLRNATGSFVYEDSLSALFVRGDSRRCVSRFCKRRSCTDLPLDGGGMCFPGEE